MQFCTMRAEFRLPVPVASGLFNSSRIAARRSRRRAAAAWTMRAAPGTGEMRQAVGPGNGVSSGRSEALRPRVEARGRIVQGWSDRCSPRPGRGVARAACRNMASQRSEGIRLSAAASERSEGGVHQVVERVAFLRAAVLARAAADARLLSSIPATTDAREGWDGIGAHARRQGAIVA